MYRSPLLLLCGIAIVCDIQYTDEMTQKDMMQAQVLEMRRGAIVLVILSHLHTPHYGYELLQKLEGASFSIDAGTLYPLLRRLEKQGVLGSEWNTADNRPRKYYHLSNDGARFYSALKSEWQEMTKAINVAIKE